MIPRVAFLVAVASTLLWLRPGPADRLVGRWVLDEAAWAAVDPDLSADPALRAAVLETGRRLPVTVVFGIDFALTIRGHTRRGPWRVLSVRGDRVEVEATLGGVARRLVADVGWGRCVLDVGLGHPLPLREVR